MCCGSGCEIGTVVFYIKLSSETKNHKNGQDDFFVVSSSFNVCNASLGSMDPGGQGFAGRCSEEGREGH